MSKHALKTVYFHEGTSFHMQGKNFGSKIDANSGAVMCYDDKEKEIHIHYQGKASSLSSTSAKNWDYIEVPDHIKEYFTARAPVPVPPKQTPSVFTPTTYEQLSPSDPDYEAKHRAMVRAASANSNRPDVIQMQNDALIQASRGAALNMKQHSAQVQTAQQVGEVATSKKKIMTHAQLKAQMAVEAKENV